MDAAEYDAWYDTLESRIKCNVPPYEETFRIELLQPEKI